MSNRQSQNSNIKNVVNLLHCLLIAVLLYLQKMFRQERLYFVILLLCIVLVLSNTHTHGVRTDALFDAQNPNFDKESFTPNVTFPTR